MSPTGHIARWLSRLTAAEGLDLTGYVARLERHFQVALAPAELEPVSTLADLQSLIASKRPDLAAPAIWLALREITSHEFGLASAELHPQTRFVEDLNC